MDILAYGEPMVEFNQTGQGEGRLYLQGFGGDSSNFAIAAARQGARVGYWSALGDYEDGRFANPARELQGVTLETANKAMRELLLQPGYLRIEKPLLSDDQVLWLIAGGLGVVLLVLIGWRLHRRKPAKH